MAKVTGPGTNHWMVGIKECATRIADLVGRAKTEANISAALKLKSLGLSLSGCEQEATNKELEAELRRSNPNVSAHYVVCSDTVGSIASISPNGGVVLISGTGSNALLRNPDGTTFSCGGWGNMLGDEGSGECSEQKFRSGQMLLIFTFTAWWIAHRAIKTVFDDMDNFAKCPYPIDVVWALIKAHFKVETRLDLLDHCYAHFEKPFFASLCKELAAAANDGDQLSASIFTAAGRLLARSILALLPNATPDLTKDGELRIACVGSVWNSWDLLREGFTAELDTTIIEYGISMGKLTETMALGACYLAADALKYDLARDYSKNYEVFHCYNQKTVTSNGVKE